MASTEEHSLSTGSGAAGCRWVVLMGLVGAVLSLIGCDSGSRPAPAPPPPAAMPVAAPSGPPPQTVANPPAEKKSPSPAISRAANGARANNGAGLSGDIEPLGKEGEFLMLDDPDEGGSLWALDLPDAENNVDRFAFVPTTGRLDSSTFAVADDGSAGSRSAVQTASGTGKVAALPEGFTALPQEGFHSDGLPWRIRCEKDGTVMALVPDGVFVQGKNGRASNAAPEHGVALDSYYIDVYEVTIQKYADYRESARSTKRPIAEPAKKSGNANEPVTGLSWAEARAYATWSGRELPSEAEWEKAARGSQAFDFPWGNGSPVWHRLRKQGQIDDVGSFRGDVSPFGVCDLAGNAREWCNDLYHEQYYAQLARESGSTAHNPTGPKSSSGANQRVVKGGDPDWFVWARAGGNVNERATDVGFRCVLHPKPAKKR